MIFEQPVQKAVTSLTDPTMIDPNTLNEVLEAIALLTPADYDINIKVGDKYVNGVITDANIYGWASGSFDTVTGDVNLNDLDGATFTFKALDLESTDELLTITTDNLVDLFFGMANNGVEGTVFIETITLGSVETTYRVIM